MANNDYRFTTIWRVESTVREIMDILNDAPGLARWWRSVYLEVEELEPGDANGLGKRVALYTKGWLPYTLRWSFRTVESRADGFSLLAEGDFVGRGDWHLQQDGAFVNVRYDWAVRADKPLLKRLSFLMKPIFAANHRWAMGMGERSLKLELARRRGEVVPAPPGPTFVRPKASSARADAQPAR